VPFYLNILVINIINILSSKNKLYGIVARRLIGDNLDNKYLQAFAEANGLPLNTQDDVIFECSILVMLITVNKCLNRTACPKFITIKWQS
jgi:hypothetical protein